MALELVSDYITAARTLLQDEVAPYRYPDTDIVKALNMAIAEAVRLRPDLFFKTMRTNVFTQYSTASTGTTVVLDHRYRQPVLYYIVGWVQLRDDENTQDARAAAMFNQFTSKFLTPQA